MTQDSLPPIAAGIFVDDDVRPDHIRLRGARHRDSGRIVFPFPAGGEADHEELPLEQAGRLWSFTVQRFRPKTPPYDGPDAFEPYAVGYVELAGQLIVESRLTGIDIDTLRIGMPLRLIAERFVRQNGQAHTTFAFTGAEESSHD